MSKSNRRGAGRAHITHTPNLSVYSRGTRPAQFDPSFEVPNQNEPTSAHPVSQHKQFKGHTTGGRRAKGYTK